MMLCCRAFLRRVLQLTRSCAVQAVKSLMVWAADAMRALDSMGASPLDLAIETDAQHAIAILRSL